MNTKALIKASGLASILCGAVTAIFWFLHPAAADPKALQGDAYWAAMTSTRYMAVNASFVLILILSLFALIGIYAVHRRESGFGALLGFILGFTGTALFIGAGVFQAFVAPLLAAKSELRYLLAPDGPILAGPFAAIVAGGGMIFALGLVILGIIIFRGASLPRWAGIMLAVSSPVLGTSPLNPLWLRTAACIVWGGAFIWFGWALWKNGDERAA